MIDARRIVITGAGGHVGGRLLKHFCTATHHKVRPHFRTTPVLPAWARGCDPTFGDLRDASVRRDMLSNADVVIHLATRGYSALRPPSKSDLEDESSSTVGLVRDSITSGVSCFVFISSVHVFGNALAGNVNEFTSPTPSNEYGRSKLQLEKDVYELCNATTMRSLILRMANTFGAPAFPQPATWNLLIHDLCRQAVTSSRLVLNTNGLGYRNFLALHDATRAISQVSTKTLPTGTYLLAGQHTYQIREIAEIVRTRAELILQKSLMVDTAHSDITAHQHFTLQPTSLKLHGITVGDSLVHELDELIRVANQRFCTVQT